MLINAGVIILILIVWMMVAGSIAPDLLISAIIGRLVGFDNCGWWCLPLSSIADIFTRTCPSTRVATNKINGAFFNYRIGTLCLSHRDARNRGDGAKTIKGR